MVSSFCFILCKQLVEFGSLPTKYIWWPLYKFLFFSDCYSLIFVRLPIFIIIIIIYLIYLPTYCLSRVYIVVWFTWCYLYIHIHTYSDVRFVDSFFFQNLLKNNNKLNKCIAQSIYIFLFLLQSSNLISYNGHYICIILFFYIPAPCRAQVYR